MHGLDARAPAVAAVAVGALHAVAVEAVAPDRGGFMREGRPQACGAPSVPCMWLTGCLPAAAGEHAQGRGHAAQHMQGTQQDSASTPHLLSTQDQCLLWQRRGFLVM